MTARLRREMALWWKAGPSHCLRLPSGLAQDLPEGLPDVLQPALERPVDRAARIQALKDVLQCPIRVTPRSRRRLVWVGPSRISACSATVSREWTRVARVAQPELQVDEAHEFQEHGGVGPEVLNDQVDLVDLEFRDVEQHGDVLTG